MITFSFEKCTVKPRKIYTIFLFLMPEIFPFFLQWVWIAFEIIYFKKRKKSKSTYYECITSLFPTTASAWIHPALMWLCSFPKQNRYNYGMYFLNYKPIYSRLQEHDSLFFFNLPSNAYLSWLSEYPLLENNPPALLIPVFIPQGPPALLTILSPPKLYQWEEPFFCEKWFYVR